jgi:WD40 repeat protein
MSKQRAVATLRRFDRGVGEVAFSPDGKTLATASDDRTAKLWDVARRTVVATAAVHPSEVLTVAFSPDNKTLVSASSAGLILRWNMVARSKAIPISRLKGGVRAAAFSPDGQVLATIGGPTATLWNTATWKKEGVLVDHGSNVLGAAFSPDGQTLATGSDDRTVKLWDVRTRRVRPS